MKCGEPMSPKPGKQYIAPRLFVLHFLWQANIISMAWKAYRFDHHRHCSRFTRFLHVIMLICCFGRSAPSICCTWREHCGRCFRVKCIDLVCVGLSPNVSRSSEASSAYMRRRRRRIFVSVFPGEAFGGCLSSTRRIYYLCTPVFIYFLYINYTSILLLVHFNNLSLRT